MKNERFVSGNRENSDTHSAIIDNHQTTCLQFAGASVHSILHSFLNRRAEGLRSPEPYDTRGGLLRRKQDRREVEILCHNHIAVLARPCRNDLVFGGKLTNAGPVADFPVGCSKYLNPARAEIHIDQQLHAAAISTSLSSARAAAYARQASTSAASRYGYARSTSSLECPAASSRKTFATVTRSPRMQGFPAITFGFTEMRFKSSDTFARYSKSPAVHS